MTLFPEASAWRGGMQDVSVAIDDTMGEWVSVTPARPPAPNHQAEPDESRTVVVRAVFSNRAKTVILDGGEKRTGRGTLSPLITTSEPIFSFGYGALPFSLRQSYRITRQCGGETYEITDVRRDGVSRIVVHVVQLGKKVEVK